MYAVSVGLYSAMNDSLGFSLYRLRHPCGRCTGYSGVWYGVVTLQKGGFGVQGLGLIGVIRVLGFRGLAL